MIDSDQGRSGASAEQRDGFQHLVTEVALGHAGIVLGLEVSRLARNNADWHRLVELCAMSYTLILDQDGVYDPAHFNDRLLLGLKGTMSEAELHVLRARLIGGQRNKARRGELELPLPIGFVYSADGAVILDPDQQIQDAVRWIFVTFRQTRSATQLVRRFNSQKLLFPRRIRRGIGKGDVLWGDLNHSRAVQILHNPRYAGAYFYGRTRGVRNAQLKVSAVKVPRENWLTLIRDAHVGYIGWEEFERNQEILRTNCTAFSSHSRGGMPREGIALLQGRVICGRCGLRMRVRYQRVDTTVRPYYQCTEDTVRRGASTLCQSIPGALIDAAISVQLLAAVAPAALEVALAVQDEIAGRIEQSEKLRRAQLERARYETELARRRFLKVDPDHRLVADNLEAEWNEKLRRLNALTLEHEKQRQTDKELLNDDARRRILALSEDFPRIWNDPNTPSIDRKRMVALLIEDVTLIKADQIAIHVRWRGGRTASFCVEKPKPMALVRKTRPEVIQALDELLDKCTDTEADRQLNARGHRTWQGQLFNNKKVGFVRTMYGLKSCRDRLLDQGFLTGEQIAARFGISPTTVHLLGRAGLLRRRRYGGAVGCLYEPLNGIKIIPGVGGRRPRPPKVIRVRSSRQETV